MSEFAEFRHRIEAELDRTLDAHASHPRLKDAMRYSVLAGGKRIRALLAYLSTETLGLDPCLADAPATAIEFIHAYSLIHDDLPAMDDDDMRRGKPSCHIAYDQATAILAGDALQALAFEAIGAAEALPPETRLRLSLEMAKAAGGTGMVGGQMTDLCLENTRATRSELEAMHRCKTGALIVFSARIGGIIADADSETMGRLEAFGDALGLAFQIRDDILDATGESGKLGKSTNADVAQNKSTFVTTLGVDSANVALAETLSTATAALAPFGPAGSRMASLARFVASRDH